DGDVRAAFAAAEAEAPAELEGLGDGELFIDLVMGLATPPSIGRNLFGARLHQGRVERADGGELIAIVTNGAYSFKGTAYRRAATGRMFDRIQLVQGDRVIRFVNDDYNTLGIFKGGDETFEETGLFRTAAGALDPLQPFRLELLVASADDATPPVTFPLTYQLPARYIIEPPAVEDATAASAPRPIDWVTIWTERAGQIEILLGALTLLTLILGF